MKKRILAMLLAVMLTVGMLPMGVLAADSDSIRIDENGYVYFNTFEDLKLVLKDEKYKDCAVLIYTGYEPLVIEEDLVLSTNEYLSIFTNGSKVIIPEGVRLMLSENTEIDCDYLVVKGNITVNDGRINIGCELLVSGGISLKDGILWLSEEATVVGNEKISIDEQSVLNKKSLSIYTMEDLKRAVQKANEETDKRWKYTIYFDSEKDFVINESISIPTNTEVIVFDNTEVIVADGVRFENNSDWYSAENFLINGELINNGMIELWNMVGPDGDFDVKLHFSPSGRYDGSGTIIGYWASKDSAESVVSGLDLTQFKITEEAVEYDEGVFYCYTFEPISPCTNHVWDNGAVATDSTCTEFGVKTFTCTVCGVSKTEDIPAKGHTEVIDKAVAATCTATGKTEGKHCSVCDAVIVAQKEIPAAGHKFSGGKCSVCGAKDPDYVAPTPTPTPVPPSVENPFTDVPNDAWYAAPVLWAKANNVTGGKTETTFGPDDGCTRAQVVTFLWAANGKPEPKSMNNPFKDVADNAWYLKPVLWAVEQGITGGVAEGKFGPEQTCTRAQIATFLYAAAGKPEVSGKSSFKDVADTDWFAKPIIWAAENEVTGGIGDGKFGPNNTCTRAQVVTFLYKVYADK